MPFSADWAIAWGTFLTVVVIVATFIIEGRRKQHEKQELADKETQKRLDGEQAAAITTLQLQCRDIENSLTSFKLEVAKEYHPKDEIKQIVEHFVQMVNERFNALETLINSLRKGGQ